MMALAKKICELTITLAGVCYRVMFRFIKNTKARRGSPQINFFSNFFTCGCQERLVYGFPQLFLISGITLFLNIYKTISIIEDLKIICVYYSGRMVVSNDLTNFINKLKAHTKTEK